MDKYIGSEERKIYLFILKFAYIFIKKEYFSNFIFWIHQSEGRNDCTKVPEHDGDKDPDLIM